MDQHKLAFKYLPDALIWRLRPVHNIFFCPCTHLPGPQDTAAFLAEGTSLGASSFSYYMQVAPLIGQLSETEYNDEQNVTSIDELMSFLAAPDSYIPRPLSSVSYSYIGVILCRVCF